MKCITARKEIRSSCVNFVVYYREKRNTYELCKRCTVLPLEEKYVRVCVNFVLYYSEKRNTFELRKFRSVLRREKKYVQVV